jgi:RimJ/RimL family protein N-acetyltransferase
MSRFPDQLSSARLVLRPLRRDDAEALCAYRSRPEVARYLNYESFARDDAVRLIEAQLGAEPDISGTWFYLAIVSAATDRVIGDCGLQCKNDDARQMKLGITLAPRYQGRGYAYEAVGCLLHYVFGSLNKHRVVAVTDVRNRSSAALFRRLGFRQEAHFVEHRWFKGQWSSEFVFAMLRREWKERNAHHL